MKKFSLKTKTGERIACRPATCIEEAIKLFSLMKNLKKKDLVSIFVIEEEACKINVFF